jgi:hypothetical protein
VTGDHRLVIAFAEPPASWGFHRAKSGKCWFRKIQGRQWAVKLGQELAALGIHGVIKKAEAPEPYTPRTNGTLGQSPKTRRLTTTRTGGYSASPKNSSNSRRRGRGRRGM